MSMKNKELALARNEEIAVLTVKDVAERLNVSLGTVYALVSKGELKAFRIGVGRGTLRIAEDSVGDYLEENEVTPVDWPKTGSLVAKHLGL